MSGRLPGDARRFVRLESVERDVEEELGFHFDRTVEELMSQGRSRSNAEAEARRRFGDVGRYRRDLRTIDRGTERRRRLRDGLNATTRMAIEAARSIVRSPALTLGIVVAFALGIGANATMFGIIDRLLLRPPSQIAAPDEVSGQIMGTEWKTEEDGRNWQWLDVYGRIADGATAERAAAEATVLHRAARLDDAERGDWGGDPTIVLGSLIEAKGPEAGSEAVVSQLLAGVSLLVLLIACVNVANLLFARTLRQRREIAVRLALGISRYRLVGQLVLEGVLLALLGGAAALAIAHWGGGIVRETLLPDVVWDDGLGDRRVLIAIAAIAILAGAIAAIVPAMQIARRDVADTIRQATAGGLTRTTSRVRTSLALAQTVLSVVLLIGAGLFVRSLDNVRNLDLGFDPAGLAVVSPRISNATVVSPDDRTRIFNEGMERMRRVPGVQSVSAAATMPFRSRRTRRLRAEGVDSITRPPSGGPYVHEVAPDYFETMGIDIIAGRGITAQDVNGAPRVAVIGKTMAEYLWPRMNPIGKCLYVGGGEGQPAPACSMIVGVAEDASNIELRDDVLLQYYLSLTQMERNGRLDFWFVRMNGEEGVTLRAIRREVLGLDSRIRYADAETFEDVLQPKRQAWALGATMFGIFGLLALMVAAIGLYSVLAFDVAQRMRELGLRTALGATTGKLLRMVVSRAVAMTVAGLVIGCATAFLIAPRLEPLLFDTSPRDPGTFAIVTLTLLAVAVAAAAIPGWRATRVDPNVTLRAD